MENEVLVVFCTFPAGDKAAEVAHTIVGEKLAACVNLIPAVRSIYRWKAEVCDDSEVLAIIKTARTRFDDLRARLISLHPYDCPEVIAMPVEDGHGDYLEWVVNNSR